MTSSHKVLLSFYNIYKTNKSNFPLQINNSREELSLISNISTRTLSRVISTLFAENYISLVRQKIWISKMQFTKIENELKKSGAI